MRGDPPGVANVDHGQALAAFSAVVAEAGDLALGAADVHEAQGRRGALPARISPLDPSMTVVGPAYPVWVTAGDNLWIHRAIETAPAGSVLVVAPHQAVDAGYIGEIMALAALQRGLAGLVIDGQVRDRSAVLGLGLPVFSTGLAIRGTGKDPSAFGGCGAPVVVGDVQVSSGDLVLGDEDGVVVVPGEDVTQVARKAIERKRGEVRIMERLRAGETTVQIYGLPREP